MKPNSRTTFLAPAEAVVAALGGNVSRQTVELVVAGVGALLLPVALALTVFPTATSDTRELIAWGRAFPLVTPKHPPLMTWVGGLTDWALGHSAAASVFVGQILIAIGIAYLYATLRLVIERRPAAAVAFLFATSLYVVGAPLSYALNADILQLTSWPAVVYHALMAQRSNRLGHWLALGVWAAVAALTKYDAVLLFAALAAAAAIVPEFRTIFRNPRLYLAVLVGLILVTPHLIELYAYPQAFQRGGRQLLQQAGLLKRITSIGALLGSYFVFLAPAWILIAAGRARGDLTFQRLEASPRILWLAGARFLVVFNIVLNVLLVLLILFFRLHYLQRFSAPFLTLLVLALAPLIVWNEATFDRSHRRMLVAATAINALLFVAAIVSYSFFLGHDRMQEPTEEAAQRVMADWHSRYSCDPRYFIGQAPSVFAIANAATPHALGLSDELVRVTSWFDDRALDRYGAVLVSRDEIPLARVDRTTPHRAAPTDERQFTLPLVRTWANQSVTYHYRFIPPTDPAPDGSCTG